MSTEKHRDLFGGHSKLVLDLLDKGMAHSEIVDVLDGKGFSWPTHNGKPISEKTKRPHISSFAIANGRRRAMRGKTRKLGTRRSKNPERAQLQEAKEIQDSNLPDSLKLRTLAALFAGKL